MKKRCLDIIGALCVLAPFLCCCFCCAQTVVKGTVMDGSINDVIIGANIIVEGTTEGTVSEFDGSFEFSTDRSYPVSLEISYIGFDTRIVQVNSPDPIIVTLEESSQLTSEVVVKAQRVSDDLKKAPLTLEALDAIAIKETPSSDFYSGLGSLKGVDLTTASLGFTVINTRGFNSTSPVRSLQLIDGVDNQSPGLNFSLGNFLGSSELDIQNVELIVGASSAYYGPNAFNGVINMETRNPFFHRGLAASVKAAERAMLKTELRWADNIENSDGHSWMAYKLNFSYLRADDWEANNFDPITDLEGNNVFTDISDNPGRYNAVNIYGDEFSQTFSSLADQNAGLNSFNRTGFKEVDVVDYDTRNTKLCGAIHFRTNPSQNFDSPEIIIASNFGSGTTVYQGDNRFSLRNIRFYQNRIEFRKKDKFFIRAYATNENAGDSYDPFFTALKIQEYSNEDENWANSYRRWWTGVSLGNVFNRMKDLGYPAEDFDAQQAWQVQFADSLAVWHTMAAEFADSGQGQNSLNPLPQPGTAVYDSLFNDITSRKNNDSEGGTKFSDRSALYHVQAEYNFNPGFLDEFKVGGNVRLYRPNTEGTIFDDEFETITNNEFGLYAGGTKNFGSLTTSATVRFDKNENFDPLVSPAASIVWNPAENNYLRLSFSSAIRNPTLSDQYLNLSVGPARLLGNITGYDSLLTLTSFQDWSEDPTSPFVYKDIPSIQPEKVKTFEVGYRTAFFESLYLDASYYYNIYNDFIGYQIGVDLPFVKVPLFPGGPLIDVPDLNNLEVLRISANSQEVVTTQGFAIGFNYYFGLFSLSGNYSWNKLNTQVDDDIVPAFNTPEHKYNVSLGTRNQLWLGENYPLGFNINYKWIDGFIFEGSPQFTGFIPSYDMIDAQININLKKLNTIIKIGAQNILDNRQFQTYGGPRIGRLAYVSATYEFKEKLN